jgi:hypothetical protein
LRSTQADEGWLAGQSTRAVLDRLSSLKGLLLRAEREEIGSKGIHAPIAGEVRAAFRSMMEVFALLMSQLEQKGNSALMAEMTAVMQRELLPYLLLTGTAARFFSKPRGYAGDCETIALVYANAPSGSGRIGPLIDACFLERPGPKAVRNRRGLVAREILATLEENVGQTPIASLACGPAAETFDVFETLRDKSRLLFTAIDIDREALEIVSGRARVEGYSEQVTCHQANLVYLSTGRQRIELAPQALVYSVGLIDYFNDHFVIELLDWIHDQLKVDGRVLLGNFHPRHADRHFMDQILEWKLIHRDEADMNRLFMASKFARPCSKDHV